MAKDVTPSHINDEQQSWQALRQYGGHIITAIILVLSGYFGWSYWQKHGGRIDQEAVNDYAKIQSSTDTIATLSEQAATDAKAQQQLTAAQATLNKDLDGYIAKYGDSVYTWQALMLKAKQQADSNDFKGAVATLKQANALKIGDAGLEAITTLRFAQALLADNQADAANQTLQAQLPAAFDASKAEILGDIAMQKNDKKSAIAHYQKAWQAIEARNRDSETKADRALLRVKMENLGLFPKPPDLTNKVVTEPATPRVASAVVMEKPVNTASAVAPASAAK